MKKVDRFLSLGALICWIIYGIFTMASGEVSMGTFITVWFVLILYILDKVIRDWK